jgi:GAF domain-containing protein
MKAVTTGEEIPIASLKDYLAGRKCDLRELIDLELTQADSDVARFVCRLGIAANKCLESKIAWGIGGLGVEFDQFVESDVAISSNVYTEVDSIKSIADADTVTSKSAANATLSANPILDSVFAWKETVTAETASFAREQLAELLGAVAERFHASTAAIFKLHDDGGLDAFLRYNMRNPRLKATIDDEKGIVSYVAREQHGYCAPDTTSDRRYREDVPDTRSELAVPIIDPTSTGHTRRVLAVLNLESTISNSFSWADVEELQVAAGAFVHHLLVLEALDAHDSQWLAWHPELHGWDLSRILQRLCHTVAEALDRDSSMCTIWYMDRPKNSLFVYATSGYDIEYKTDRVLPMESCTGRAAMQDRRTVLIADPQKDFLRSEKAAYMGIREAFLCPVHAPESARSQGEGGVVNIYFRNCGNDTPVLRDALVTLADFVGSIALRFDQQRPRIAGAQLHHLLYEMPRSSESDFEVIRDFLKEVFAADGCTIFARRPEDNTLICAATTGLQWRKPGNAAGAIGEIPCYHLNKEHGYTIEIALNPGECVRMNNVLDRTEGGLPSFLPDKPLLKYRENFAPRNDDNRRLLAIAIEADHSSPSLEVTSRADTSKSESNEPDTFGVFRILRRPHSRPFTRCDEHLLWRLTLLCKNAFVDWRRWASDAYKPRVRRLSSRRIAARREKATARLVLDAATRIIRPLPVGRAPRTLIDELLRDLFQCYAGFDVNDAALLVKPGTHQSATYRLHAYFSSPDPTPPVEIADEDLADNDPFITQYLPLRRDYIAGRESRLPIALAADMPPRKNGQIGPQSNLATAGVRIPVIALSYGTVIDAVLLLNFTKPIETWKDFPLEYLLYGAARLEAIWSMTSSTVYDPFASPMETLNPELAQVGFAACIDRCRNYVEERFGVRTIISWAPPPDMDEWTFVRSEEKPNFELFGLMKHNQTAEYAIPLRIGPIPAAQLIVQASEDKIHSIAEVVTSIWSPLTIGRINLWDLKLSLEKSTAPRAWQWSYDFAGSREKVFLRHASIRKKNVPLFAKL